MRLSHLSPKAFLHLLQKEGTDEFAPIEMAKRCGVTNRTIINWCAELANSGFLEPLLVRKRIRSYKVKKPNQ